MDLDQRIAQFENMAAEDAENDMAHFSLGSAYLQAERHAEAATSLQRCIELNPEMSKAYQLVGEALIGSGQERLLALGSALGSPSPRGTDGHGRVLEKAGRLRAPISLEEILGQAPPWYELVGAVISGGSGVAGGDWHRGELTWAGRVKGRDVWGR